MQDIPDTSLWRDAAALFLAAAVLGFAYNSASPLGIRTLAEPPAEPAGRAYSNETLNLEVQPTGQDAALRNETLSVEVLPGGAPAAAAKEAVTWPEVRQMLSAGPLLLVDARSAAAFDAGHIPGAVSLPFADLGSRIAAFLSVHPRSTAIVVYCADTECPVSEAEADALRRQYGFTHVREMPGGYVAWRMAEEGARK